jgi:hypothetical protein
MPWQMAAGMTGGSAVNVSVLLDGQAIEPRMIRVVNDHDRAVVRQVKSGTGRR